MTSNPRTAIAELEPLHYLFVVSDGRTSESKGLSLYELAEFLSSRNVTCTYNLDGGGSSTMYFNGQIINHPTPRGNDVHERSVSDIVCLFLYPLLGGTLIFFLLQKITEKVNLSWRSLALYQASLLTFMAGSLISGILEIYGTISDYTKYFWFIGTGCGVLCLVFFLLDIATNRATIAPN